MYSEPESSPDSFSSPLVILVTGGAGYVGSVVCRILNDKGYEVIVLDNLSQSFRENVQWGELVEGDIRDLNSIRSLFSSHKIDAVIHLAAKAYVSESLMLPLDYYVSNVLGTLNLLMAMKEFHVDKIIFASSCSVYGLATQDRIVEDELLMAISPYGESKAICERLISDVAKCHDMSFAILRFFNVAGADLEANIGDNHAPETHVIPLLLDSAIDKKTFSIFGTTHKTDDGTSVRDFIHVLDVASVVDLLLGRMMNEKVQETFNVGSGIGISIRELVHEIESFGLEIRTKSEASRPGDPSHLISDNSKISEYLDWQPQHSSIREIVETSVTYRKNRKTSPC
jgi:UDP-glucose 4-epimerase